MDRGADARIGAAAADVGDCAGELLIGGMRICREEGAHRHDHARLAVATLRDLMIDPGLLNGAERAVCGEAFDGGDLRVGDRADGNAAASHGFAIHMNSTSAAGRDAAAVLCAGQAEFITNDPKQWRVGLDVDLVVYAVDF